MAPGRAELCLYWDKGRCVRIQPDIHRPQFRCEASGQRTQWGSAPNAKALPRWWPYAANRLKIRLTPKTIECWSSTDGRAWRKECEFKREKTFAGAPAWLIPGSGSDGKEPLLMNPVNARYFVPARGNSVVFFSDVLVGKD